MGHRNFVTEDDDELGEGPTFTLGGKHRVTKEPWEEEFACVPVAPAGALADLTASVGLDKKGNTVMREFDMLRFFEGVMVPEDWKRFDALVHDQDRIVKIDTLADVMTWLTEELSGVPTTPRSTSQAGPRRTGRTSGGGSRGRATPARAS